MTKETILAALEAEGVKAGAAIPESREATFFIGNASELMPVGKIVKVEVLPNALRLVSARDERSYFPYESVLGLRILGEGAAKERGPGFGR